jgi:hypothetical protein
MKNSLVILFMLLISRSPAFTQKIKHAFGEAQARLEEHMSKDELKEQLKKQAIIKAIENTYGTAVAQDTRIEVKDGHTRFDIEGSTRIRGEWLKTISETYTEEVRNVKTMEGNRMEIWVKCKIEGKVREILRPEVVFNCFPGNCPEKRCKTTAFKNGEPMYLFFKAPVDGYLSVFIVENGRAFRILPYQRMPAVYAHNVPVEANREYVFFSNYRSHDYFPDFSYYLADELLMVTEKDEEKLEIYVVFSQAPYSAPMLDDKKVYENGEEIPKSLPDDLFKRWLEDNRIYNAGFNYKATTLRIVK